MMSETRSSVTVVIIIVILAAISIIAGALLWAYEYKQPVAITSNTAQAPEQMDPFLDHLQFLWERYLEMVQLLITLLTGVIAVSAGMVKFGPRDSVANRGYFAAGIISLLVGLVCAVLWRVDVQLLMEIEIFGNRNMVASLYGAHGVLHPFTTSYEYSKGLPTFSFAERIFEIGTAAGFLAGLALMSFFAYSNLPEATRHRSHS